MALWQFSCLIIPKGREPQNFSEDQLVSWKGIELATNKIESADNFLPNVKSWSKEIQQYGKNDSTCIEVIFENNEIAEISCRLDVRDLSKQLIEEVVDYIDSLDGDVFCDGKIYPSDADTLLALVQQSEAIKFCKNPGSYFEGI